MSFNVELIGFSRDSGGRIFVTVKQPGSLNKPFDLTLTQDQADHIWRTGRIGQRLELVLGA